MPVYLNSLIQNIYLNTRDGTNNFSDFTYDITTDIDSLKNYLSFNSELQRQQLETYTDITNYELIIDDSWFVHDNSVLSVIDIYQTKDSSRYDSSIIMFTRDNIIYDQSVIQSSAILHFVIKINKNPDITENSSFFFPLFIKPNIPQIANDLVIQYNIFFVNVNFINEYSLLRHFIDYIKFYYILQRNEKLFFNFIGQNDVIFLDYKDIVHKHIIKNMENTLSSSWFNVYTNEIKHYFHTPNEQYTFNKKEDLTTLVNLFYDQCINFYKNNVTYTIDFTSSLNVDRDLFEIYSYITKFQNNEKDILHVNFIKFLLIRNNWYQFDISVYHNNDVIWQDKIFYRVKNIIPNWNIDFSFNEKFYEYDITAINYTDIPVKIDILEYSNNLIQAHKTKYSDQINKIYLNHFDLSFNVNKNLLKYGQNNFRIFLSDTYSETKKNINHSFVYAPHDIIKEKIAKIEFIPHYERILNTWNPEFLIPFRDDYTSLQDFSAILSNNAENFSMSLSIPITYELIYASPITIRVFIDSSSIQLQYLNQDNTEFIITLEPTLNIVENTNKKQFTAYFKYRFKPGYFYTDDIIQKMNSNILIGFENYLLDKTHDNYFLEWTQIHFITTRFKLRPKSTTPIAQVTYSDQINTKLNIPMTSREIQNFIIDNTSNDQGLNRLETPNPEFNKTKTVKSIPIKCKCNIKIDYRILGAKKIQRGSIINMGSPLIGYMKDYKNFITSTLPQTFFTYFIHYILNYLNNYQSNIGNEFIFTLQNIENSTSSPYSIYKDAVSLPNSQDSSTFIDFVVDKYNLSYNKPNEIQEFLYKNFYNDWADRLYSFVYQISSSMQISYLLTFNKSNIYNGQPFYDMILEEFLKTKYPNKLPKDQKYSEYNDFKQRKYYLHSEPVSSNQQHPLETYDVTFHKWLYNRNLTKELIEDFMEYVNIPVNIDGTQEELSINRILNKIIFNEYDNKLLKIIFYESFKFLIEKLFSFGNIQVSRVYTADLEALPGEITDDIFAITIQPTLNSRLYSTFKITNIKYIYNETMMSITELFDRNLLIGKTQKINDIMGTGIKLLFKYLVTSIDDQNVTIIVEYNDEYNNPKSTSTSVKVKTKLQLYEPSLLNEIIHQSIDLFKLFYFFSIFDKRNGELKNREETMKWFRAHYGTDTSTTPPLSAEEFLGNLFSLKNLFMKTFSKYLSKKPLETAFSWFYDKYCLGLDPGQNFESFVNYLIIPENLDLNNKQIINKETIDLLKDKLSKRTEINTTNISKTLIENVIKQYNDGFIKNKNLLYNFVLSPDTTYSVKLKTYLLFHQKVFGKDHLANHIFDLFNIDTGKHKMGWTTVLFEFLQLLSTYPELKDIVEGTFRSFQVRYNFSTYGRFPTAQNPITIIDYNINIFQNYYESLINNIQVEIYTPNPNYSHIITTFVIPFEHIVFSIDTTSTGSFYINLLDENENKAFYNTEFTNEINENLCSSNIEKIPFLNQQRINVVAPELIPEKYIDVIVKRLF